MTIVTTDLASSRQQLQPNALCIIGGYGITVANEALTVDFGGPQQSPRNDEYWIVRFCSVKGWTSNAPLNTNPPISGLFIVRVGEPADTLAQGQSVTVPSPGVPLSQRGQSVGSLIQSAPLATGNLFQCIMNQGQPIIPPGYMMRFVGLAQPGTPAPGPGALSSGEISATIEIIKLHH